MYSYVFYLEILLGSEKSSLSSEIVLGKNNFKHAFIPLKIESYRKNIKSKKTAYKYNILLFFFYFLVDYPCGTNM